MLLKLESIACALPPAELLVLILCCGLREANRHFCILCLRGDLGLAERFISQFEPLIRLMVVWLHSRILEPPRGWCAGEELAAQRKDWRAAHTTTAVKAKPLEPQLGLRVINTTSPATSNPLFDPFHSPQGDHDLHFEKYGCSTTKLRGEVHWQYAAVNLG